jgi:predicted enzyme related to lactoylglutathione lyase
MTMATGIGYLTLSVAGLERAMAFYGALFGWTFEHVEGTSAHVANTALPMGLVAQGAADLRFLYFRVDDIAAMAAKVAELGGRVLEEAEYPSGLNTICADPGGTVFSLWQPAAGY